MNGRNLIAGGIALVVVVALAATGWYLLWERPPQICELSGRVIHENMRTVVKIDGKTYHACCSRCPLTVGQQTGGTVEFISVTDYVSRQKLDPSAAYFVDGSRVQVCSAPRLKMDEARTPYLRLFDRCNPSLLAFARAEEARAFIAKNGGSLKRLNELMRETAAQSAKDKE